MSLVWPQAVGIQVDFRWTSETTTGGTTERKTLSCSNLLVTTQNLKSVNSHLSLTLMRVKLVMEYLLLYCLVNLISSNTDEKFLIFKRSL